jgi:hypothetical protein
VRKAWSSLGTLQLCAQASDGAQRGRVDAVVLKRTGGRVGFGAQARRGLSAFAQRRELGLVAARREVGATHFDELLGRAQGGRGGHQRRRAGALLGLGRGQALAHAAGRRRGLPGRGGLIPVLGGELAAGLRPLGGRGGVGGGPLGGKLQALDPAQALAAGGRVRFMLGCGGVRGGQVGAQLAAARGELGAAPCLLLELGEPPLKLVHPPGRFRHGAGRGAQLGTRSSGGGVVAAEGAGGGVEQGHLALAQRRLRGRAAQSGDQ